MARKPNSEDVVSIEIINDKELLKLFKELQNSVQNRIVINGMKKAGKIVKDEIKRSFLTVKKNKSTTNYEALGKFLKIEELKTQVGVKIGFTQEGYKYRWLQWGTNERSYKRGVSRRQWAKSKDKSGGHNTGFIKETNFFYGAAQKAGPQANDKVSEEIIKSLEATVRKYSK